MHYTRLGSAVAGQKPRVWVGVGVAEEAGEAGEAGRSGEGEAEEVGETCLSSKSGEEKAAERQKLNRLFPFIQLFDLQRKKA